jgi:hypothetical protein
MATDAPSAQELIRRLVARAAATSDGPTGSPLAVQAACERTYRELTRRLGQTGSSALFSRALAQAQVEHPALGGIRIGASSKASLEGVTEAVRAHGAPQVAAGLEATLEKLLGLLSRLIGDDMVVRLVESSAHNGNAG